MKEYSKATIEVVTFEEDVITSSGVGIEYEDAWVRVGGVNEGLDPDGV